MEIDKNNKIVVVENREEKEVLLFKCEFEIKFIGGEDAIEDCIKQLLKIFK